MSYQGWACSAWRMDWDYIKSILPKETEDFENACAKEFPNEKEPIEEVAFKLDIQDEVGEDVMHFLDTLADKFYEETGGLGLQLGYIGSDEVDSEIYGAVWFVDGVKEYTPAGEKYANKLHYERWVEYG